MLAPKVSHIKAVCLDHNNNVFVHNYPSDCYYSRGRELENFVSQTDPKNKVDLSTVIILKTLTFVVNPTDIEQIEDHYKLKLPKHKQIQFNNPSAILGSEGLFEIIQIPPKYCNKGFQIGDWCIPLENDNFGTWSTFTTVKDISNLIKIKPVNVNNDTAIVSSNLDIYSCSILSVNSLAAYALLNEIVTEWNDDLEQDYVIINQPNSQMGKLLLQMAKYKGIKSIAVISDSEEILNDDGKVTRTLFKYGATYVISESKCKSEDFLKHELPKTLGDHGRVRLALDAVSGDSTYHLANLLSENGKIVTYGSSSNRPSQIPSDKLIFDNCQHTGFWLAKEQRENPDLKVNILKKVLPLFEKGILKMPKDNIHEIVWDYSRQDDIVFLRELSASVQQKKKVLVRLKH